MLSKSGRRKCSLLLLCSLFCTSFITPAAPQTTIKIAVTQRLADFYQSALKKEQKQVINFTEQNLIDTTKGFVSLVILQQALHKGGLSSNVEFIISPNLNRSQLLVQSGDALLTLTTIQENYTLPNTFKSSPLIHSKDMVRGIYGLKSNHALMKVKALDELKKFTATTNSAWREDLTSLQAIEPAKLDVVSSLKSVFTRIAYRNIDFTLLDLPKGTPEFQRHHEEIILVPVPGLFINTRNKRHFLISEKHPDSQITYQALEKGLKIMREQGLIKKYYRQVKQFPSDIPDWKILNTDG